ncbi:MAG: serine/threonine-protein phosphatase [Bryobacteraceae bacterium]|nr:serine/threonine-protein phosphatase [Bryobacteraceae bacterium]
MPLLAGTLLLQAISQIWVIQVTNWLGAADLIRYFHMGAFVFDSRNVTRLIVAVAIVAILYRKHRHEQQRQSGVDCDLAQARVVQESLLAGRKGAVPGFTVETAYLSASEVGGDFYQELAGPDGSLLVLVGDVSGKGMRAALLVGHISGALSNERSRQPAEVLANLNQSLVGRVSGGFVTCCCARFDADGTVTVANAGHLARYMGGREVEVEAGLPLVVVGEADYTESSLRLDGVFLLTSDGVVEAENTQRELFGFDRTREISTKSAREIAEAAKAWGQNDDITVVTVRRAES